jgi:hypothetical protein
MFCAHYGSISEIFSPQAGVFRDSGEHPGANFVRIVKSPSEFRLRRMHELDMRRPFSTAWFRSPANPKQGLINFPCFCAWPATQGGSAGAGKRKFKVLGRCFPGALNSIGEHA